MTATLVHIKVLKGCRAGILQRGLSALRAGEEADVPAAIAATLISQGFAAAKTIDEPEKDKMQKQPTLKKG